MSRTGTRKRKRFDLVVSISDGPLNIYLDYVYLYCAKDVERIEIPAGVLDQIRALLKPLLPEGAALDA